MLGVGVGRKRRLRPPARRPPGETLERRVTSPSLPDDQLGSEVSLVGRGRRVGAGGAAAAGWLAGTRESPERKGRDDTTVIGAAPPVVRASELTMAKPDCRRKDWGPLRQAASKLDC